ncbi:MAG: hypothetical protein ACOCZ8_04070 [Bacteroidota bacterium]
MTTTTIPKPDFSACESIDDVILSFEKSLADAPQKRTEVILEKMANMHTAWALAANHCNGDIDNLYLKDAQSYADCLLDEAQGDEHLQSPSRLEFEEAVSKLMKFLNAYGVKPSPKQQFHVHDLMFATEADSAKSYELLQQLHDDQYVERVPGDEYAFTFSPRFIDKLEQFQK